MDLFSRLNHTFRAYLQKRRRHDADQRHVPRRPLSVHPVAKHCLLVQRLSQVLPAVGWQSCLVADHILLVQHSQPWREQDLEVRAPSCTQLGLGLDCKPGASCAQLSQLHRYSCHHCTYQSAIKPTVTTAGAAFAPTTLDTALHSEQP